MRTKILVGLGALLVLTGCTSYYDQPNIPTINRDVRTRQAEIQLAKTATSIDKSMQDLISIQRAVYPSAKLAPPPSPTAIGMGQMATIDWAGPIEPLVREITKVSHYKLRVLGKAPAVPVLVSVHYDKTHAAPVATILRNAAFQCGKRVDIVAYPRRRILELRYNTV